MKYIGITIAAARGSTRRSVVRRAAQPAEVGVAQALLDRGPPEHLERQERHDEREAGAPERVAVAARCTRGLEQRAEQGQGRGSGKCSDERPEEGDQRDADVIREDLPGNAIPARGSGQGRAGRVRRGPAASAGSRSRERGAPGSPDGRARRSSSSGTASPDRTHLRARARTRSSRSARGWASRAGIDRAAGAGPASSRSVPAVPLRSARGS